MPFIRENITRYKPQGSKSNAQQNEGNGGRLLPGIPVVVRAPVQLLKTHSEAILGKDYFDADVRNDRAAFFARLRTALIPFKERLIGLNSRYKAFLEVVELPALADNPLTLKITALTSLIADLAKNPTQTRWNDYQAREADLLDLDDQVLFTESYAHEKARIQARLRKIRTDTVGTREFILGQLGENQDWLNEAGNADKAAAVATLRTIKAEVDKLMASAAEAASWKDFIRLPDKLHVYEGKARAATDGPFAVALADDWENDEAEEADPRAATNYFKDHILDRHKQSSAAAGAGKFNTDSWATIKARIDAALAGGEVEGPIFNDDNDHPQGRFEITHDSGALMGHRINGAATNSIFLVVTRSGKSVVTAYPV